MKGKISKAGYLYVLRGGPELQRQYCPFGISSSEDVADSPCGDWCPHFGEPVHHRLKICQGKEFNFKEFVDDRGEC